MKKILIINLLVFAVVLAGCKPVETEKQTTLKNDNKELCRYWVDENAKIFQQKIDTLEQELNDALAREREKETFTLELGEGRYKKYENKTYGYTIEMPESWGAIYPLSNEFKYILEDEMSIIGLYLGEKSDNSEYSITIQVFNQGNSSDNVLKEYGSWFNYYKNKYLMDSKDFTYITDESLNELLTKNKGYSTKEFTEQNKDGEYLRTCRLMENKNGFYAFCYNKKNDIHKKIIESIILN